jgi:hypothetical protein
MSKVIPFSIGAVDNAVTKALSGESTPSPACVDDSITAEQASLSGPTKVFDVKHVCLSCNKSNIQKV